MLESFTTLQRISSIAHNTPSWNTFTINSFIHLLIPQWVLRQVHSLFQSEFSIQCDPVLPLSISSIMSFGQGHPVDAYFPFFVIPSLLILPSIFRPITCLRRQFLRKVWPNQLTFLVFNVFRTHISSLALWNTSFFSHYLPKWSSPSFSSTTFQTPRYVWSTRKGVSTSKHNCLVQERNLCVLHKQSNTTILSYLLVHRTNNYMFRPCMWAIFRAETCSC